MPDNRTLSVPDIGGTDEVDVIEILVKPGDTIEIDDAIITLESEKASMEIPSTAAGIVSKVFVKVGDKVQEGTAILEMEEAHSETTPSVSHHEAAVSSDEDTASYSDKPENDAKNNVAESELTTVDVCIPDIGGASNVDVIEISVAEGDFVDKEQTLLTLESDKATMDIPAPHAGKVIKKIVAVGDKVSEGSLMFTMELANKVPSESSKNDAIKNKAPVDDPISSKESEKNSVNSPAKANADASVSEEGATVHAGPAVRRMAHELGVALSLVHGSGRKNRIMKEDITSFVKAKLNESQAAGIHLAAAPTVDFAKFGEIEISPLNKIKRLTGKNVHRSWINIPHVTQFDETDITDLESFRKSEQPQAQKNGYKLTVLAFIVKAVYQALRTFPQFNASLDNSGDNLILKQYYNIGIAVDTPNGLVVPVVKEVDRCSVADIAREMARLSSKAREKGLMPGDMSGGCFTISSLGGVGGTAFTPIVNSPEVAILGLSRASIKPIYINHTFEPRLILPMSLSYDHRVIDGVEAAQFTRYLAELLSDVRRLVLGN